MADTSKKKILSNQLMVVLKMKRCCHREPAKPDLENRKIQQSEVLENLDAGSKGI